MNMEAARVATLVAIVQGRTGLGRTALMKLCYFLQTLRGVPLGYDFTLYSYGPFDSTVLSDLATAESLGGVISRIVQYSSGYGYEIEPTGRSRTVVGLAPGFVEKYRDEIDWVVTVFGDLRRAELEVLSTIVYVDRAYADAGESLAEEDLVRRVRDIKPNYSEIFVTENVRKLIGMELLEAVGA